MSAAPEDLNKRLGNVRVGCRQDLHVTRHLLRDKVTYIVHDPTRFASHQLEAGDYQVFVSLTSDRTLDEVFRQLVRDKVLQRRQENEFYHFVVYLNQIGLLDLRAASGASLYERFQLRERARRRFRPTSLLFLRIPLFQPDAFLQRTLRFVRPLFSRAAFVVWLICAAFCGWILWQHWLEFTDPLSGMLTSLNLPLIVCLLVGLKVIHEFGHAYACKRFGGHVPEMGAFLMAGVPCAYVDASAAWSFRRRLHRLVVSLAGVYFESIMAMASLVLWFVSDNPELRSIAHYTFLLSSAVTVAFNINPLMRYDGYYVLADLVNMPNLRSESSHASVSWVKWLLFGVNTPKRHRPAVRFWLILFGIASAGYRCVVITAISTLVIGIFPVAGILLCAGLLTWLLVWSMQKLISYLRHSKELNQRRWRAGVVSGVGLALVGLLFFGIPTPRFARAYGIVERDRDVLLRAGASGFLLPVARVDGETVKAAESICRLESEPLDVEIARQQTRVDALQMQVLHQVATDVVGANMSEQQRLQAAEDLDRLTAMREQLTVRAPVAGEIMETRYLRDAGRYVRMGEPLVRVSAGKWILKVMASESDFSRCDLQVGQNVRMRLAGRGLRTVKGRVLAISGTGRYRIDDLRLTQLHSGPILVDPTTQRATAPWFEIQIELGDEPPQRVVHGMRGVAMLPCRPERIGVDVYRTVLRFLYRVGQQREERVASVDRSNARLVAERTLPSVTSQPEA